MDDHLLHHALERRLGADALERRLGAEEGEAFDRRLREHERIEREERLSRIAWGAEPTEGDAAGFGPDDADFEALYDMAPPAPPGAQSEDAYAPLPGARPSLSQLQMERELRRLTAYYNAVEGSRVWRFVQRLRRIAGRAW